MKKWQPQTSMKYMSFLSFTLRFFVFYFLGKLLSGKQSIDYDQFGQWQLMAFIQGFILLAIGSESRQAGFKSKHDEHRGELLNMIIWLK